MENKLTKSIQMIKCPIGVIWEEKKSAGFDDSLKYLLFLLNNRLVKMFILLSSICHSQILIFLSLSFPNNNANNNNSDDHIQQRAKIIGKFASSKEEFLNGCTLRLECIMVNFRFRGWLTLTGGIKGHDQLLFRKILLFSQRAYSAIQSLMFLW